MCAAAFSPRLPADQQENALSRDVARLRADGIALSDLTISNPTRAGIAYPETLLHALADPAALRYDPQQAGGIDQSLATLGAQPFGRVMLGVVALGLAAYGAYGLAEARWRRMRMA